MIIATDIFYITALVLLPAAAAQALDAAIGRESNGTVRVTWSDPDPDVDGYALKTREHLAAGPWDYAGSGPDDWPLGGASWTAGTATANTAFYRVEKAPRGSLVSTTLLDTYSPFEIGFLLALYGISGITPVHSVSVYAVRYHTFDHRGLSTLASGALCLPATSGPLAVPLVSYQHGTIFKRDEAPSSPLAADQLIGVAMATEGYAVALPDYIGLGPDSPALHPFVHARSEAVAAVDLLRVSRTVLDGNPALSHDGKLFLVGYSQGGHATLALHRELELRHADEFTVTASAPMAGPHDLSGVMKDLMLSDAAYSSPSYVAYLLFGLNGVYRFFASPSEVLRAPYDTTLPPLLDGTHSSGEVSAAMPSVPKLIFTDEFLGDFQTNPENPLRRALTLNDTYRWTPAAPVAFYHCSGDTVVPALNSQVARNELAARGATNVWLFDPAPGSNHSACALPAFLAAKAWFDTLR